VLLNELREAWYSEKRHRDRNFKVALFHNQWVAVHGSKIGAGEALIIYVSEKDLPLGVTKSSLLQSVNQSFNQVLKTKAETEMDTTTLEFATVDFITGATKYLETCGSTTVATMKYRSMFRAIEQQMGRIAPMLEQLIEVHSMWMVDAYITTRVLLKIDHGIPMDDILQPINVVGQLGELRLLMMERLEGSAGTADPEIDMDDAVRTYVLVAKQCVREQTELKKHTQELFPGDWNGSVEESRLTKMRSLANSYQESRQSLVDDTELMLTQSQEELLGSITSEITRIVSANPLWR
jgi:hypothetical protein